MKNLIAEGWLVLCAAAAVFAIPVLFMGASSGEAMKDVFALFGVLFLFQFAFDFFKKEREQKLADAEAKKVADKYFSS